MRRRTGLLVVLLSVVGAGCGVFLKPEGQQSAERLLPGLVDAGDMPSGWEESRREVFLERTADDPSIDPRSWCPRAAASKDLAALAGGSGAIVELNREKGRTPGFVRLQAWSNKDVVAYVSAVRQSAKACDGVESTDAAGVTVSMRLLTGRSVGDESVSWSSRTVPPFSAFAGKFASFARTTVARFGQVAMVMQVEDAGPPGSSGFMPEGDWWPLVQRAAEKLATRAG